MEISETGLSIRVYQQPIVKGFADGMVGIHQIIFRLGFVATKNIRGGIQISEGEFDVAHGLNHVGVRIFFCPHQSFFTGVWSLDTDDYLNADFLFDDNDIVCIRDKTGQQGEAD